MANREVFPGSWESLSDQTKIQVLENQRARILDETFEHSYQSDLDVARGQDYADHLLEMYLDLKVLDLRDKDCASLPADCVALEAAERYGMEHPLLGFSAVSSRLERMKGQHQPGYDLPYSTMENINGHIPDWFLQHADLLIEEAKAEIIE